MRPSSFDQKARDLIESGGCLVITLLFKTENLAGPSLQILSQKLVNQNRPLILKNSSYSQISV